MQKLIRGRKTLENPKLYVWNQFYRDHLDGIAFAIADNETQAREMIINLHGHNSMDWGPLTIMPVNKAAAGSRCGSM